MRSATLFSMRVLAVLGALAACDKGRNPPAPNPPAAEPGPAGSNTPAPSPDAVQTSPDAAQPASPDATVPADTQPASPDAAQPTRPDAAAPAPTSSNRPAPGPNAQRPLPTGVLRGRVTFTLHGPGADDGRPPFANVTGLKCTITASRGAHDVTVTTKDDGSYELKVVPGDYEVFFAECVGRCARKDLVAHAKVISGEAATANWNCDGYAK